MYHICMKRSQPLSTICYSGIYQRFLCPGRGLQLMFFWSHILERYVFLSIYYGRVSCTLSPKIAAWFSKVIFRIHLWSLFMNIALAAQVIARDLSSVAWNISICCAVMKYDSWSDFSWRFPGFDNLSVISLRYGPVSADSLILSRG